MRLDHLLSKEQGNAGESERCLILKARSETLEFSKERRGYSSAGRAPALQEGGHRFEPDYLHHPRGIMGKSGKLMRTS